MLYASTVYEVKVDFESLRRHRPSRSVECVGLRIHLRASWLVRIVEQSPSRYGRSRSTDHTTTRYLRCAVSYRCSVLVREREQYSIDLVVLSGCSCRRAEPTRMLYASVSNAKCAPKYSNVNTGGVMGAALGFL